MSDDTEATLPMDYQPRGGGGPAVGPQCEPGLLCFHPLDPDAGMPFVPLGGGSELVIGRGEGCDVRLDDRRVSRRHAVIKAHGGKRWIEDAGSTSGVWVQGRPVESAALHGGEVIRLAATLMRYVTDLPAVMAASLPVDHGGAMVSGPGFARTRRLLDRAARSDLSVLITGQTGTGKELAARHLHTAGDRGEGPFVPVNCSAIPADLFESELFGHRKGAFTGATEARPGYIRQAHGGTLFLDEIGELPAAGQAKLLRVLQDRKVYPVGGSEGRAVDIRLVCATNSDLDADMAAGTFRPDLFARVAELRVRLPSLARRLEEIPLLVQHFISKHGEGLAYSVEVTTLERLCLCDWPMNIRQLEGAVRRALFQADDELVLRDEHFAEELERRATPDEPPAPAVDLEPEDEALAQQLADALRAHHGNAQAAADALGISRSQLYRRASKVGVKVGAFRK